MSNCTCSACVARKRQYQDTDLRARAEEYASALAHGSQIIDDTDAVVVAPFKHLLPGLLYHRGLFLVPCDGGQVVVDEAGYQDSMRARFAATAREGRVVCRQCGGLFVECSHEATLILGAPQLPAMPWLGVVQPRARS